jgi:photosystem II stability/assembly factor-like uncharacterized protein
MKKFTSLCVALLFMCSAHAQWAWQNSLPQGNALNQVVSLNSTTLVGVGGYGTVLRSTDSGTNWTVVPTPTTDNLNDVQFFTSSVGVAVGNRGAILRTTDGGLNWSEQRFLAPENYSNISVVNATLGFSVVKSTTYSMVIKTTNAGASWDTVGRIGNQGFVSEVRKIVFSSEQNGVAIDAFGNICRTTNGGTSWIVPGGSSTSYFDVVFTNATTGYLVGTNSSNTAFISKTTNGGATWQAIPNISNVFLSRVFFADANNGYATGSISFTSNYAVYRTTNAGGTWTAVTGPTDAPALAITAQPSGAVCLVGTGGVIYTSTNSGTNWTKRSTGTTTNLFGIQFSGTNIGYAVGNESGVILKTTNGGTTWTSLGPTTNARFNDLTVIDDNTVHVVGTNKNIYRTTNGGTTWTLQFNDNINGGELIGITFTSATAGYAVGLGGVVVRTTNGGTTWAIQTSQTIPATLRLTDVLFTNATTGFIVGQSSPSPGGFIYRTTDGGTTWAFQSSIANAQALGLAANGSTLFVSSSAGLFRSTNGGTEWLPVSGAPRIFGLQFPTSTIGYAITSDFALRGSMWKTTDGGATWGRILSGTSNVLAALWFTDANTGYIAGQFGTILKTTTGGGGFLSAPTTQQNARPTKSFALEQNYPNPFNPSTAIRYQLSAVSDVRLEVFDMLGRKVSTLVNERQAAGSYQATFNAAGLASGIYFYKLQAGSFSETKKMMLVK